MKSGYTRIRRGCPVKDRIRVDDPFKTELTGVGSANELWTELTCTTDIPHPARRQSCGIVVGPAVRTRTIFLAQSGNAAARWVNRAWLTSGVSRHADLDVITLEVGFRSRHVRVHHGCARHARVAGHGAGGRGG